MLIGYKRGQGSVVLRVKILNSSVSTGAGLTGLTFSSSGLIISSIADNESSATAYTVAGSTIETITTLGTYAAPTATKCRFKEVDSTNHKGVYEIQIADARFAVSNAKSLLVSISGATNAVECDVVVPLRDLDPYDAVRAGLTAIPNVASGSAGAIITSGTGTAQLSVSSGIAKADVDTIKTNPVVNAGTVTFPTGATLASTTNITAGTVTTATNVTTVNGLAAGVITATSIAADAITDAKVASDVTIASVTGAVGSVTGNVGGNVVGSVASVSGAVGSVTGNVGGNVVGSVGSVTGAVGSVTGNVGGNVTGSIGSLAAQAKADVNSEVVDCLNVDTYTEPSAVPAATSTLRAKIGWIFALLRNRRTQTSSTETLLADDGSTTVSTSAKSDDGTTLTRGEWS